MHFENPLFSPMPCCFLGRYLIRFTIAALLIISGCNKEEDPPGIEPIDYVLAGEPMSTVIIQEVDSTITLVNNTAGGYPTTASSGEIELDINLDGSSEIRFYAYSGLGCPAPGCLSPVEGCQVMPAGNTALEIVLAPLGKGDTINENLPWHEVNFLTNLSSYTPASQDKPEISINEWHNENLYLAIRVKEENGYKYGWLGILIRDYCNIAVRNMALEWDRPGSHSK